MTIKEMKELAVYAAKGQAPTNFSVENVDDALRDGLRELAGSVNQFMKNRYDIYEIEIDIDNNADLTVDAETGQLKIEAFQRLYPNAIYTTIEYTTDE